MVAFLCMILYVIWDRSPSFLLWIHCPVPLPGWQFPGEFRIPNDTTAISLTDSSNRAWEVAKSRHSPNGMGWWNFTTYPIKETSQTHQTQHFGDFFCGRGWDDWDDLGCFFFGLYYFDVKTGRQTDRQTWYTWYTWTDDECMNETIYTHVYIYIFTFTARHITAQFLKIHTYTHDIWNHRKPRWIESRYHYLFWRHQNLWFLLLSGPSWSEHHTAPLAFQGPWGDHSGGTRTSRKTLQRRAPASYHQIMVAEIATTPRTVGLSDLKKLVESWGRDFVFFLYLFSLGLCTFFQ